jgi:hypothetical protein
MAIVTGINAVLAFAGLTLVKRMAPKQISSVSRYVPPRELKETLAALQEAAARVEVDFNDPFFDTIQEDEQVDGQPSPRAEEAAVAEGA